MPQGVKSAQTASPFTQNQEAVFTVDSGLNVTLANQAATALLGATPGLPAAQIRAAWRRLIAEIAEALREDRSFERVMAPEHSATRYHVSATSCSGGAVVRLRRATPADPVIALLGVGPGAMADVLDASGMGLFVVDASGVIVGANANFADILEYTPEELEGRDLTSITHVEDVVIAPLEFPSVSEHPRIIEKRYMRKSGSVAYVRVAAMHVPASRGEGVRLFCLACDMTSVKANELTIRQSEWRFRSMVDNMDDLVTILDTEARVVYVNPAVERMLGFRSEERIGHWAWDILHPDDAAAVSREWSECLSRYGSRSSTTARLRHKDGSWRTVETLALNMLHNPSISGVLGISHDITDRLEARNRMRDYTLELERRNRDLLQNMNAPARHAVSGMVEEIHTPLIGLGRLVDLLVETRLEASQRECTEHIQDSIAHLLKVVEQMLGPTRTVRANSA